MIDRNTIENFFSGEIGFFPGTAYALKESLSWGFSVFGILFFFRPFGISDEHTWRFVFICCGFGVTAFIVFFLNTLLIKNGLYRHVHRRWRICSELLFFGIVVPQACLLNFVFSGSISLLRFSVVDFGRISLFTEIVLSATFLIKSLFTLNRKYREEMLRLNTKIDCYAELEVLRSTLPGSDGRVKLRFDTETLDLPAREIVLISAWGNYIKILIRTNTKTVELVKRGTIKDTWDQVSVFPEFHRCHRSYIVNINHVKRVAGTTKKASLVLFHEEYRVPVSRERFPLLSKVHSAINRTV